MPKDQPAVDVSVLIVNYNTAHLLKPMFDALEAAKGHLVLQYILVDNASRDGSAEHIRQHYPDIPLILNAENVGFGRANNQGLPLATGRYVLLLNTDAFVAPDTLRQTVAHLDRHPNCGALGVRLIGRDGTLQPSCRYFPTPLNVFLTKVGLQRLAPGVKLVDDLNWDHRTERSCDWVPGCYLLMPRRVIDETGLFDPIYFLYCEEVDLCRRIKSAGHDVTFLGTTEVIHLGGESAKSEGPLTAGSQISALQIESEMLYFRKFHGLGGLVAHIFLCLAGNAILAIKAGLKGRWRQSFGGLKQNTADTLRLAKATRMGTQATR